MKTTSLIAFSMLTLCCTAPARAQTLEWIRQIGSNEYEWHTYVTADGLGNAYIACATFGSLGVTNAGGADAFLSKYDASGTHQWTQHLGTSVNDGSTGVLADVLGNVYISGMTDGSLGGTNAGSSDAFLAKYDASGTLQWTQQFGTSGRDGSVTGRSTGLSADVLGNVYISGLTEGSLGGTNAGSWDAFLAKYDASGTPQWTQQFGTSESDSSYGVSADVLGNVYITGATNGNLAGTNTDPTYPDAFLSKYDASGTHQWSRQFGTSNSEHGRNVWADGRGNAYVVGSMEKGSAGGGQYDVFLSKYDTSGTLAWTRELATYEWDEGIDVSGDSMGNVFISGGTFGSLGGRNAGWRDAFVAKFVDLSLLGDYSDNGFVGQYDLDLVLLHWGNTVPPDPIPDGWINDQPNGLIGQTSLDKVLLNWGKGTVPPRAASIPEPGTTFLLILGATALCTLFRTQGRGVRRIETAERRVR